MRTNLVVNIGRKFSPVIMLLLIIFFSHTRLNAQTQTFQWANHYGGVGYDGSAGIAIDHSGNIITTGYFDTTANFGGLDLTSYGMYDVFVAKYNSVGTAIWVRQAGGIDYDEGTGVTVDNGDNIIVTGYFTGQAQFGSTIIQGQGGADIFVAKYDPNGNLLWVKSGGGQGYETSGKVAVDNQNNVLVNGTFQGTAFFDSSIVVGNQYDDMFIAKYDQQGVLQWVRGTNSGTNGSCYGEGISSNVNNEILVCGSFYDTTYFNANMFVISNGSSDMFMAKYDPSGNVVWAKGIGGAGYYDDARDITTDASNNIYFTGSFMGLVSFGNIPLTSVGLADIFVAKYNDSGNPIWVKQEGQVNGNIGCDITLDKYDNVEVFGYLDQAIGNSVQQVEQLFLGRYRNDGTLIWGNAYTCSPNSDEGGIMPDQNNDFVIGGDFANSLTLGNFILNSYGLGDIFIAKIITPQFTVSTDTLDFGAVQIGNTNNSNVLLTNTTGATLHISNLQIGGVNASEFSLNLIGFVDSITALQTEGININFNPLSEGAKTAYLIIQSDAASSSDTVELTGIGGTAPLTLSADTLDFGSVDVNNFSERTLTITNSSTSGLIIDSISLALGNDSIFTFSNLSLPDTLVPLDYRNLIIRFTPLSTGLQTDIAEIYSNSISSPDAVLLIGTGISGVTVQEGDTLNIGQGVTLNLIPPSGFIYTTYQLFYKMAGDLTYQVTNLTNNGLSYTANLPPAYSTIKGIQYYAEFSDGLDTITYPSQNPVLNPASIQLKIYQYSYPLNIKQASYQMISLPITLNAPQIDSVLNDDYGQYDNRVWRIFRWNPLTNQYDEYPNLSSGLIPGDAFWLINRDGKTFDINNGNSVPSNGDYIITLQPGWNQISDPFAFAVDWDSIGSSLLVQIPIGWNRDIQDYEINQTVLQPWDGYWVYNPSLTGNINLLVPPIASQQNIGKKNYWTGLNNDEFVVQLKASLNSTNIVDQQNYIGMLEQADNHLNILKPPPVNDNLRLSIMSGGKKYAQNIVKSSKEGVYWDLNINSSNKNKTVNIALELKSNLPDGFNIWLLDIDKQTPVSEINNEATVNLSKEGNGNYRIIVGTEEFAKNNSENISLTPLSYELYQNYPNPFNPTTNISYQLKERSSVTLNIYDILGRRVASLVNNQIQNAGQHILTWNGRNSNGNKVVSGVYIYRIIANNFISSKKMILLK
jgi:FlgD Ig-like domain/Cep192 domain 4